jgi:hypothetical protein
MPMRDPTPNSSKVRSAFTPMKPSAPVQSSKPVTSPVVTPPTTVSRSASQPAEPEEPVAPFDIVVTLRLAGELPNAEPVRVRSVLGKGGERIIQLWLNAGHLVVSRSLTRADTLIIKFLLCLALAEYIGFWRGRARHDGGALREAIIQQAAIEPENFWGISLASRLCASELLRSLDTLPIFGPSPSQDSHTLFTLPAVRLRERSELPNWRVRNAQKKESTNV